MRSITISRPDGLRRKPWLDLIGPDYIDIAFQTAHAADPKARLVLNECFIEHDTPVEIGRREALLGLATRLKRANIPITGIGVQGHLRGTTPLDKPGMTTFLKEDQGPRAQIMVTELDVDDTEVPAPDVDRTVASKYGEFLDLMMPYVKVVAFEQLRDDPALPKPTGRPSAPPESFRRELSANARISSCAGFATRCPGLRRSWLA